jgi:UDP-N-acetylglucosamine 2-epimerase (non-hydrolysing)
VAFRKRRLIWDIPCLTLRDTTERPITVTQGTNRLLQPEARGGAIEQVVAGESPRGRRPELWDGRTAERVARSLRARLAPPVLGREGTTATSPK